jgi:hypothetical protein
MVSLAQLQQNRRIIQDFISTALVGITNPFTKPVYVASLRKHGNDAYQHAGLVAVYPEEAVQQALEQCHEELIVRILESPLSIQERDLRAHLSAITPGLRAAAMSWRNLETHRELLPRESPDYLKELFCSNMRTMLDIIAKEGLGETISSPKVRQ